MKLLLILVALLFPALAIAAAPVGSCADDQAVAAERAAAASQAPCHEAAPRSGESKDSECGAKIDCAMLCGAILPSPVADGHPALSPFDFELTTDALADASVKPEAPPPRARLL